jgi:hypothetical protein
MNAEIEKLSAQIRSHGISEYRFMSVDEDNGYQWLVLFNGKGPGHPSRPINIAQPKDAPYAELKANENLVHSVLIAQGNDQTLENTLPLTSLLNQIHKCFGGNVLSQKRVLEAVLKGVQILERRETRVPVPSLG